MAYDATSEDEIELALPGSKLTHVMSVVSGEGVSAAIAVLEAVHASGGRLEGLSLAQRGDRLDHQLRLCALTPSAARRLCDQLSKLPEVSRATVEHHLYRAP